MPPEEGDGWAEWRRHVLKELQRLAEAQEQILKGQSVIQTQLVGKCDHAALEEQKIELERHKTTTASEFAALKVKAGIWGVIGAGIPTAVWILYELVSRSSLLGP